MDQHDNNHRPLFHSRLMIFVFTFFLGAFFGSLLSSQNLKEAGKRNFIAGTIIAAMLFNYFFLRLLTGFGIHNGLLRLFAGNIVAAWFFAGPYWNYHFKNTRSYKQRSIWGPLLAIGLVYGFFITMNIILPGIRR